jgi:hypothetical protein
MPDLADVRWRDFEGAGKCRIILELEPFKHRVEQVIRIVTRLSRQRMDFVQDNLKLKTWSRQHVKPLIS